MVRVAVNRIQHDQKRQACNTIIMHEYLALKRTTPQPPSDVLDHLRQYKSQLATSLSWSSFDQLRGGFHHIEIGIPLHYATRPLGTLQLLRIFRRQAAFDHSVPSGFILQNCGTVNILQITNKELLIFPDTTRQRSMCNIFDWR